MDKIINITGTDKYIFALSENGIVYNLIRDDNNDFIWEEIKSNENKETKKEYNSPFPSGSVSPSYY